MDPPCAAHMVESYCMKMVVKIRKNQRCGTGTGTVGTVTF
jgi:hypothetical protein